MVIQGDRWASKTRRPTKTVPWGWNSRAWPLMRRETNEKKIVCTAYRCVRKRGGEGLLKIEVPRQGNNGNDA